MSTTHTFPSVDQLQEWANDPQAALQNLPAIFASLDVPDLLDWANEALENCGPPNQTALPLLEEQLAARSLDCVYWACKLIGRCGVSANATQESLCRALDHNRQADAVRQQAVLALSRIGELTAASRTVVEKLAADPSKRVAELAHQILRPKS